jgi:protein-tyrosine phosphatase
VIDIHCHVLPGLDDGPASMHDALALAEAAAASGTTVLVATPHIDHTWRVRPERIPERAAALQHALSERGVQLEIRTGAEIAPTRLPDLSLEQLSRLRLGDGPYLLLECPLSSTAGDFDALLLRIRERGELIVLAHPERSPLFQREPARLAALVRAGLLCAITAGAIEGAFGQTVRGFSIELLREQLVHAISSDAHDVSMRPPGIGQALASVNAELPGIERCNEWLTVLAPRAILAGEPLPPRPAAGG